MTTRSNKHQACLVAAIALLIANLATASRGQLILNEANTLDADRYLQVAFDDAGILNPYEGYDFGALPFSGKTNPPDGPDPGNPYPIDLDTETPGNQTTLLNGWNGATGWGRIQGNGGDWYELVVTTDHTDLRGYTLYWETDDPDLPGIPNMITGEDPSERGFVRLTRDKAWADLRAGTIITLSEQNSVDEIRDDYPFDFPDIGIADTGFNYDLNTNLSFNPFTSSDWHIHFHLDEDVTKDLNTATQYFEALSDAKGHNRLFRMAIFDASNTTLAGVVENAGAQRTNPAGANYLDLNTGKVQDFVGEGGTGGLPGSGASVPGGAGGVSSLEMFTLVANPATGISLAFYEDLDWSSFGMPNVFNTAQAGNPNAQDDSKLGGVQDFSAQRDPVLANTYDWTATGSATFGAAANWENANSGATPATGPQSVWTVRLINDAGGSKVSQVVGNQRIQHGALAAAGGTMTLEVQSAATLSVGGAPSQYDYNGNGKVDAADYTVWRNTLGQSSDLRADGNNSGSIDQGDYVAWTSHYGEMSTPPNGRLLVFGGGILRVDGTLAAGVVEIFDDGKASGQGLIRGNLLANSGTIAPGNGTGVLTVEGNYAQIAPTTLEIELGGAAAGQHDRLAVTGTASLAGRIDISLINGFTPNLGDMFTIVTASSLTANLTLAGDSPGFNLVVNPSSLVLHYVGPGAGTAVPEPTSGALVAVMLLTSVAARRRRAV